MKIHLSGERAYLWGDWINTEMSYSTIDSLTGVLDKIESAGKMRLSIDCAYLENIDSSGAQFLDIWLQCLKLRGIDHEIINVPEKQLQSFERLGRHPHGTSPIPFTHKSLTSTKSERRYANEN